MPQPAENRAVSTLVSSAVVGAVLGLVGVLGLAGFSGQSVPTGQAVPADEAVLGGPEYGSRQ